MRVKSAGAFLGSKEKWEKRATDPNGHLISNHPLATSFPHTNFWAYTFLCLFFSSFLLVENGILAILQFHIFIQTFGEEEKVKQYLHNHKVIDCWIICTLKHYPFIGFWFIQHIFGLSEKFNP